MAGIKHTLDFRLKDFKGKVRGSTIHDAFLSLKQLLTSLPLSIAMDIELRKLVLYWQV